MLLPCPDLAGYRHSAERLYPKDGYCIGIGTTAGASSPDFVSSSRDDVAAANAAFCFSAAFSAARRIVLLRGAAWQLLPGGGAKPFR